MDISDVPLNEINNFMFFTKAPIGGGGAKGGRQGLKLTKICFSGLYIPLVARLSIKITEKLELTH